jgi:toxin FitB
VILLDTNIISELVDVRPDERVLAYLRRQPQSTLFTSAICEAEIRYGVARMPAGRRRNELAGRVAVLFSRFASRILPFDTNAAGRYGAIRTARAAAGHPISIQDAMIAATARTHGLTVATRDANDFAECGVKIENPWLD